MKKLLLMGILSLTCLACDRAETPKYVRPSAEDADNTGRNIRDRDLRTTTPTDQSETAEDRKITQRIRQLLMSDDSLSTNAKNIKIITMNGVVTLRGPVASPGEKEDIVRKVKNVQGLMKIDNQLEVTRN